MMTTEEMILYDILVEDGIATVEELNLARNLVSGSWLDVLHAVLLIRTGYHNLFEYLTADDDEE